MKERTLLRVPQNRAPKNAFELKKGLREEGINSVKMIYIPHGIFFGDVQRMEEGRLPKKSYEMETTRKKKTR